MKILVISLAGIGDTLFATPLIHELRANYPEARIDALVRWRGAKDLLEGNPHLNSVWQKDLGKAGLLGSLRFLSDLRQQRYDISLNTHPQSRLEYRAIARFIGAPVRASNRYHNAALLDRLLVNRTIPQDYKRHAVDNSLGLLELIGAKPLLPSHDYELFLTPEENRWADEYITRKNLNGRRILGIHVGSGGTKNLALRRWPLENYIQLIRRVVETLPDVSVLLFGGPEEVVPHQKILTQSDSNRVLAAETPNLRSAAALLKRCSAFLSVDTVMMHLAAAVKTQNQIVIETPTWNPPIEPRGNVFTLIKNPAVAGRHLEFYRYDGRDIQGTDEELLRCMKSVTVDSVYNVVAEKIGASRA
jgi:ADP-heptose:LPS heptosyltransferase